MSEQQQPLLLDIDHRGVAWVTLNRPQIHNAFDDALIEQFIELLERLAADQSLRAMVLRASGKSFSAGADLNWMRRMAGYDEQQNFADAQRLAELMMQLNRLPLPTIAQVQGAAFGGGVGLIACCDIAVGTQRALFVLSEVRLGIIPAVISPYVIAAIGERAARRYMLTTERFDANEARRIGLLHEVVEDDEALSATVERLLGNLLAGGPNAQREAKGLIDAVTQRPISDALIDLTAEWITRVRASDEGREGLGAFLEKRPPAWKQE